MPENNGNGNNGRILTWALGLSTIVAMSLASFSLVWLFNANADLKILQRDVAQIVSDKEADIRQDKTLSKHWKLLGWSKDEINKLRQAGNLPLESWPDLSD